MDLSKLGHSFHLDVTLICQSCCMYLLKLLHGFVKVVLLFCKKLLLNKSNYSKHWVCCFSKKNWHCRWFQCCSVTKQSQSVQQHIQHQPKGKPGLRIQILFLDLLSAISSKAQHSNWWLRSRRRVANRNIISAKLSFLLVFLIFITIGVRDLPRKIGRWIF